MSAKRKAFACPETKWCVLTQHRLCFANTPPRIARRDPYAFLQATRENVEATGNFRALKHALWRTTGKGLQKIGLLYSVAPIELFLAGHGLAANPIARSRSTADSHG